MARFPDGVKPECDLWVPDIVYLNLAQIQIEFYIASLDEKATSVFELRSNVTVENSG
jgi:hypothetical protein